MIEPFDDFEENIKNEVDEKRSDQLENFISQIAVDNNYDQLITQKCRYDKKFATYSDFGEITGEKINIVKNNLAVIDIDINYEDIDKFFAQKDADDIIQEIEYNLIEVASNNNAIVVKTASDSYHIYGNGESIRNDPLLANKKSSYIKAFEYIEMFECDNGAKVDIKLFDVDIFIPTEFGANCGVMLPGSRVINKKGNYSCYTIIKGKENIDEKISSLYDIWDDIQEVYQIGDLAMIWSNEKDLQSSYRAKKLNDSEIIKNGMSKEMFDLIIKGFEGVEIHNWAAPIEKEITLYPLICGLNACMNNDIDEIDIEDAIHFIKKNANLTLNAELNFDRIMFSTDDISSTPFSLLKMLRIHNPEYYKENLSSLVAKKNSIKPDNSGEIIITLSLLTLIISGFKDLSVYADFELTSDEITVGSLLGALYSCETEYITKNDLKALELDIRKYCKLSNAAERQLREIDNIKYESKSTYLIEMLKIHNPLFYSQQIEPIFYLRKGGIDLNDSFVIERIKDKNYFNKCVDWDGLFIDISRGIVLIESDQCAYVKVRNASNNSYKLIRCSMDQLKNRLHKIIVNFEEKQNIKNFRLSKLIFEDIFINIMPKYEHLYWNQGVCFYSKFDYDLSLFTGFTFPERNTINNNKICLFLDHIKNIISNGNDDLYKYILSWIAFIIQNPGKKTSTCLAILGDEGTGKTMFTTVICKLFGNYALPNIASIDDVVGQFNSVTENKMLVVLNELNATENTANKKAIHNKLKTLITEDINIINRKGIDQYEAENVSNYIICSNEFNPILLSENDRRYVVMEVNNSMKRNTTYFSNLFGSFDEEFYINLYNYFRVFNIRNFDLTKIPMTDKRRSMMNMGLDSFTFYMKQNLEKYNKPRFTASMAYDDYVAFYKNDKGAFIHVQKVFYEKLKQCCDITRPRIEGSSERSRLYVIKSNVLEKLLDKTPEKESEKESEKTSN